MHRKLASTFGAAILALWTFGSVDSASAQTKPKKEKPAAAGKPGTKADGTAKPDLIGGYGDWNVFATKGDKNKTCYALAQPKDRQPAALKRDPAYIFISTRQAENVKNEVSVILGFAVKDAVTSSAEIGDEAFDLLGKGTNAWVKNAAEEPKFVAALRKGSRLLVKMPSVKGNVTTDTYSLTGLTQALDRVAKECQ